MTSIYLVRHAEAEGNLYRRVQGHFDGLITPRGKMQIEALEKRFQGIRLDAVYSSDLTRAHETALGVAKHSGVAVNTVPALREMNLGIWENKTWGEVEENEAETMRVFTGSPESWSVPGGESFAELTERVTGAVFEIARQHEGGTVAVVSHGLAIRALLCTAFGSPGGDYRTVPHGDNTCVSLLRVEGSVIGVEYYYDTSHLPREISTSAQRDWWHANNPDSGHGNLRFVPLNPAKEPKLYIECYRDTWIASHGTTDGFSPDVYLQSAKKHAKENPLSVMKVMRGDVFSGIIELDIHRGENLASGWITLLYLVPSERSRGLAVQLVGHAVTVFRELGRRSIRLHVSQENERALRFYRNVGFKMLNVEEGALSPLYLMEKRI